MAVQKESEQDILTIYNPTNKDFTRKWGGVPRTIKAHETAEYPRFLAEHLAKHLADFILHVKQAQAKKKTGREVMLIRNKKERQKVMELVIRGVRSYYLPADQSGVTTVQELDKPTEAEIKNTLDLGEVDDDLMGTLIDDITIDEPPEAKGITDTTTKREIMEQLDVLGVPYEKTENKESLLKKLGVNSPAQD